MPERGEGGQKSRTDWCQLERGAAGDARSLTSPEVGRGDHLGGRREAKTEQGPPRTFATSHFSRDSELRTLSFFLESRNQALPPTLSGDAWVRDTRGHTRTHQHTRPFLSGNRA